MANGAGGAAAAAAARRQREQEEEEMTSYLPEDLNQYEFKIVRANWGVFRNPAKFNQLLQEEARAGWELVEKFDNERVRFKRPLSARQRDNQLPMGVDPYRSHFGMPALVFALLLLVIILAVVGVILATAIGLIGLFGAILTYNIPH